jgi:hypothetical protein
MQRHRGRYPARVGMKRTITLASSRVLLPCFLPSIHAPPRSHSYNALARMAKNMIMGCRVARLKHDAMGSEASVAAAAAAA